MTQRLPDIDEVEHLSAADEPLMRELREVLGRHGAERRFGLMLLHEHFAIGEDEVLVERVDVESRTLTVRPEPTADYAGAQSVETQWRLDSDTVMQRCVQVCPGPNTQYHGGKKEHQAI